MGIRLKFGKLSNFTPVSKVKTRTSNSIKLSTGVTKRINVTCVKLEDNYFVSVPSNMIPSSYSSKTKSLKKQEDNFLLEFTEDSYNLKDALAIFSREKDKTGRYIRYIRDVSKAKFFPGDKTKFIPFCDKWVCDGNIVLCNGKLLFDFHECLYPVGYNNDSNDENNAYKRIFNSK